MALSLKPVAQKLNELAFGLIGYKKKVLFLMGQLIAPLVIRLGI